MKDCTAIKVITEALEEYENNFNHKINILESKIILYEKERKAIIRHLKEGNIELLRVILELKMKEYYLVKCKNNIPFIVGQYDTEEEAKKAKYRESPDSELMIVVNIERLKNAESDKNYYHNLCKEVSGKMNTMIALYNRVISDIKAVVRDYDYQDLLR